MSTFGRTLVDRRTLVTFNEIDGQPHQVTASRLGQHQLSIRCNRHLDIHVLLMANKSCTQVEILAFFDKTGTADPIVRSTYLVVSSSRMRSIKHKATLSQLNRHSYSRKENRHTGK